MNQLNCEVGCVGFWFPVDQDPTCLGRWQACTSSSQCCDGLACVAFNINSDFVACGLPGTDGTPIDATPAPSQTPTVCPTELEEIPIASFLGLDVLTIPDIQGNGLMSPFLSAEEGDVTLQCIVTAVDSNLFYCQDSTGDGDDATSDAFTVFTGGAPTVTVGDLVELTGKRPIFLVTALNLISLAHLSLCACVVVVVL